MVLPRWETVLLHTPASTRRIGIFGLLHPCLAHALPPFQSTPHPPSKYSFPFTPHPLAMKRDPPLPLRSERENTAGYPPPVLSLWPFPCRARLGQGLGREVPASSLPPSCAAMDTRMQPIDYKHRHILCSNLRLGRTETKRHKI